MKAYAAIASPGRNRDALIAEHAPMARRIALRIARRTPPWLTSDDLVGAALVGLAEAADRYDDGRAEPFAVAGASSTRRTCDRCASWSWY